MWVFKLDDLVGSSDAIFWVRKKEPAVEDGIAVTYQVVEVLGSRNGLGKGAAEVRIAPGDYDSQMKVHEPPEPGMHMSPLYRGYPGQASGQEADGFIVFLRIVQVNGQELFVRTVQGAQEPLEKLPEIREAMKTQGLQLADSHPPPPRQSLWARLFGRRG